MREQSARDLAGQSIQNTACRDWRGHYGALQIAVAAQMHAALLHALRTRSRLRCSSLRLNDDISKGAGQESSRRGACSVRGSTQTKKPRPCRFGIGIRIVTFEACSGFTHVTARRIAQPPNAAFVTRLQPCRLPGRTARQLPDQSTTLWVESSSTGNTRRRGAP